MKSAGQFSSGITPSNSRNGYHTDNSFKPFVIASFVPNALPLIWPHITRLPATFTFNPLFLPSVKDHLRRQIPLLPETSTGNISRLLNPYISTEEPLFFIILLNLPPCRHPDNRPPASQPRLTLLLWSTKSTSALWKALEELCNAWQEMKSTFIHSHVFANTWNISKPASLCTGEEQCCEFASALHRPTWTYSKNLRSGVILWFVVLMMPNHWPVRTASSSEKKMGSCRNWGLQLWDSAVRYVAKGFLRAWRLGGDILSGEGQVTPTIARSGRGSDAQVSWFCSTLAQDPQPLWSLSLLLLISLIYRQRGCPTTYNSRNRRFDYGLISTFPKSIPFSIYTKVMPFIIFGIYTKWYHLVFIENDIHLDWKSSSPVQKYVRPDFTVLCPCLQLPKSGPGADGSEGKDLIPFLVCLDIFTGATL